MKPPLLFVHGFLGDGEDWAALRALVDPRLAGSCFELPGHGAAAPIGPSAGAGATRWFAPAADRLRAACAALAAPPVVVGYSMGGRLALYTAVRFPQAAAGLILIGGDPGLEDASARAERLARDEALARQLAAAAATEAFTDWLQRWYAVPLFGDLRRQPHFGGLLQRRRHGRPVHLAAALRGLSVGVQPPLWNALSRLSIPALFIAGAEDAKYRAVAERIAALGAPWQTAVCPGAAHAVHIEHPQAVAALIRTFMLHGANVASRRADRPCRPRGPAATSRPA